jgi:hypothetical protein
VRDSDGRLDSGPVSDWFPPEGERALGRRETSCPRTCTVPTTAYVTSRLWRPGYAAFLGVAVIGIARLFRTLQSRVSRDGPTSQGGS